jgi:nucleoside-diphosphate-sugar epimerase
MSSTEQPNPPLLVTGAGGFIGSVVTRLLAATGVPIRALLGPPGVELQALPGTTPAFAEIDDLPALRSLVEGVGTVVHLAGPPSVAESFSAPAEYARVHVVGTATLLEACRERDVRRFVYVSSAELYGRPDRSPVREEELPRPRSPYGATKLGAEALVRAMAPVLGFEAVILRPFSVYGPGAPRRSLVGSLLDQALHADRIVLADLRPVRDYCYVEDVAAAIVRACSGPSAGPVEVYNVGSGTGTSVADLARLALAAVGRDLPLRSGDPDRPAGTDVPSLIADVAKIERELGWRAVTPLRDGLARTAASLGGLGAGEVLHP